jgi:hypothetical protein
MTGILIGIGLQPDQVIAIRDRLIADIAANKTLVSSGVGEATFGWGLLQGLPIRDALLEVKYFLQTTDPDTYGPSVTRVRHDFSQ